MMSESEFIAGVYEKYECEKKRRDLTARRVMFWSKCVALGACASFAVFAAINIVPLLEAKNGASESVNFAADMADEEVYTYSVTYNDADASAPASVYDDAVVFKASSSEAYNGAAEEAKRKALDRAQSILVTEDAAAEAATESGTGADSAMGGLYGAAVNAYTAGGVKGEFTYTLDSELVREERDYGYELTENGEVKARIYVNAGADYSVLHAVISEDVAANGAVYGACDAGEYVRYECGGENIIMILFDDIDAAAVAATVEYELFE